MRRLATATLIAMALAGCGSPGASSVGSPNTPVAVPIDVQRFLAANGATFEPQAAPADAHTGADEAIAIVRARVTGTPAATTAVFGRLRDSQLGVRRDRLAWLVTMDGAAPPRQNPSGPAPVGPLRTIAFVDAEDGFNLTMFATGAGP